MTDEANAPREISAETAHNAVAGLVELYADAIAILSARLRFAQNLAQKSTSTIAEQAKALKLAVDQRDDETRKLLAAIERAETAEALLLEAKRKPQTIASIEEARQAVEDLLRDRLGLGYAFAVSGPTILGPRVSFVVTIDPR